jgi:hypothetical protein
MELKDPAHVCSRFFYLIFLKLVKVVRSTHILTRIKTSRGAVMPIEMKLEDGSLALFNVSGKLGIDESRQIQSDIESIIQKVGQIKILVILKDFEGWEAAKGWEDTSVTDRIDPYISKFAIVGDEKWRDLVTLFTLKGLRPVPIEYFGGDRENDARQWLESK